MKTEHELQREYRMANRRALEERYIALQRKAADPYRAHETYPTDESKAALDENARELNYPRL